MVFPADTEMICEGTCTKLALQDTFFCCMGCKILFLLQGFNLLT